MTVLYVNRTENTRISVVVVLRQKFICEGVAFRCSEFAGAVRHEWMTWIRLEAEKGEQNGLKKMLQFRLGGSATREYSHRPTPHFVSNYIKSFKFSFSLPLLCSIATLLSCIPTFESCNTIKTIVGFPLTPDFAKYHSIYNYFTIFITLW